MTINEWKKNDALMKRALKKMHLFFFRNPKTWEAKVFTSRSKRYECECYDAYDDVVLTGPSTPEELGIIETFYVYARNPDDEHFMDNIFVGVKSAEELSIKLDLME